MINRVIAFAFMCYLLAGSILLPLGDFSLLPDVPQMYRAYEKVAMSGDKGIADFVGDYLLGGKTLLGHNKHDKPEKPGAIQFQHAASYTAIVNYPNAGIASLLMYRLDTPFAIYLSGKTISYHSIILRPPLV